MLGKIKNFSQSKLKHSNERINLDPAKENSVQWIKSSGTGISKAKRTWEIIA